jgi:hypothetical protein
MHLSRMSRPTSVAPGGAVSRYLVRDGFNRADAAGTLGTAETGQAWEAIAGTAFGISGGQAYHTDTANTLCISTINAGAANVRITCGVSRTTQVAGVAFRVTDASNYWTVSMSGGGTTLTKTVAGTPSNAASSATTFSGLTAVEVQANGSGISVYVNGSLLLSATDSFSATATKHGMMRQQTVNNSRHDNFTVRRA